MRRICAAPRTIGPLVAALVVGAACAIAGDVRAAPLDSQYVLSRYALAIDAVPVPRNVVFTYTASQVGPSNIEQRHTIFRSGSDVRDETLADDGVTLVRKRIRIAKHADPYAVTRLAPRAVANQILFLHSVKDGAHVDYTYDVTPLLHQSSASVYSMTIDGVRFLPRVLHFHTSYENATGDGEITYAPFGRYWMPVLATVDATVNGKPARERIMWGDYRFPEALPASTFIAPKPLPSATP